MNAMEAVHFVLRKIFSLNCDLCFRCCLEQESLRNWPQPGQGWGCSMNEQGLQKGEIKGKVKSSTPGISTEMQRTNLNKNNEEPKLINEQNGMVRNPCVKSAVIDTGKDVCLGRQTLSLWQYRKFRSSHVQGRVHCSTGVSNLNLFLVLPLQHRRDASMGNPDALPATAAQQVPFTKMGHEADG